MRKAPPWRRTTGALLNRCKSLNYYQDPFSCVPPAGLVSVDWAPRLQVGHYLRDITDATEIDNDKELSHPA